MASGGLTSAAHSAAGARSAGAIDQANALALAAKSAEGGTPPKRAADLSASRALQIIDARNACLRGGLQSKGVMKAGAKTRGGGRSESRIFLPIPRPICGLRPDRALKRISAT